MELIVAVYDDWGIGKDGTQPIALSADRKFFRETTRGAMVIVGRRTIEDFPGQKPLPGRVNVALSRTAKEIPGFTVCTSPEEAAALAKTAEKAMVIGGGSIYRQLLPMCDTAYVTKVHCAVESDTFFPNLDAAPDWTLAQILQAGEENGIPYEMCLYKRKGTE
ncbi:MAG: dihydrofolate reductase [Oscillospiraceae bacterium]|nr:dihydrofolate reductase [Oscillospiraceae bacterium]